MQAAQVDSLAEAMNKVEGLAAKPILALPRVVELGDLPVAKDGEPVFGIGESTLEPVSFDRRGSFLISGPPRSGRTSAMLTIAHALRRHDEDAPLFFLGPGQSSLSASPIWKGSSVVGDVRGIAGEVTSLLGSQKTASARVTLFVESISEFANSESEGALVALVQKLLADGHFLVAEGETSTLTGYGSLMGLAKSGRTGLALQPDQMDGQLIFRTDFPRMTDAGRNPGKGLYIRQRTVIGVQVAVPR
jgi:S-DNA-T family DNA segregation ATPase FtsK/SpoIIIE